MSDEKTEQKETVIDVNNMGPAEHVAVLKSVHGFLSNFDRVPGSLAGAWSQNLDAIAYVVNSINAQVLASAQGKASKTKVATPRK